MKVKTNQESGTTGKPGQAPSGAATSGQPAGNRAGAAEAAPKTEIALTADGMARQLMSEFSAADPAEAAGGEEVQPAAGQATTLEEQPGEETPAAGADETPVVEGEETPEETTAREAAEAAAAAESAALPPELQSAIDEWEEQGKGQLPPVLQALFEKRIGKAVAQRETEKTRADAAEARAQELEEQNTQLRQAAEAGAPAPAGAEPDEKTLLTRKQMFKTFVRDAVGYLEDTATDPERQRVEAYMQSNGLDATGLKRHVQEAREILEDLPEQLQQARSAAAHRQALEQAAEPEIKKYFPYMNDKTSPEYQEAQKVLQAMPAFKQRPLHKMEIGVYLLGLREFKRLRAAEATAVAKPKVPVRVPPKTPASGAAAPAAARVNGHAAAESAARQQFDKAPTRESVAQLIKIGLRG